MHLILLLAPQVMLLGLQHDVFFFINLLMKCKKILTTFAKTLLIFTTGSTGTFLWETFLQRAKLEGSDLQRHTLPLWMCHSF